MGDLFCYCLAGPLDGTDLTRPSAPRFSQPCCRWVGPVSLARDRLFLLPAPHWVQNPFRACAQLPLGFFVLFCILAALHSMQDLSSWTRDQTCAPAVEARLLNYWSTRGRAPACSWVKGLPKDWGGWGCGQKAQVCTPHIMGSQA